MGERGRATGMMIGGREPERGSSSFGQYFRAPAKAAGGEPSSSPPPGAPPPPSPEQAARAAEVEAKLAARRRALRIAGTAAGALALLALFLATAYLSITWRKASPRAFLLIDGAKGEKVYGAPLTVVIETRTRRGAHERPRGRVLEPDVYGRYDPPPLEEGERADISVWHVAYKPIVRQTPQGGVITLERHEGAPSPALEADLRDIGRLDPAVAAALEAGFLPAHR